jgi:hypothetical protein
VNVLKPGVKPFAPIKDINARMPPSPRLSARMTNRQYLIEMVMINVQITSDRMPSASPWVNLPPMDCTTVCRV